MFFLHCGGGVVWCVYVCVCVCVWFIYVLKAYSAVNRTGSSQGFSLNQILHKFNTIQNMHILQT